MLFFEAFLLLFLMNSLFQPEGLGDKQGSGQRLGNPSIFRFYLTLNLSKAVKSIIWLITLKLNHY